MPTICEQFNVLDVLLYKKLELQPGLKYKRPGRFSKFPVFEDTFEPVWVKKKEHLYLAHGNMLDQSIKNIALSLLPLIFCVEFK